MISHKTTGACHAMLRDDFSRSRHNCRKHSVDSAQKPPGAAGSAAIAVQMQNSSTTKSRGAALEAPKAKCSSNSVDKIIGNLKEI